MNDEDFRRTSLELELAIYNSLLVSVVSMSALEDFPSHLDNKLKESANRYHELIKDAFEQIAIDDSPSAGFKIHQEDHELIIQAEGAKQEAHIKVGNPLIRRLVFYSLHSVGINDALGETGKSLKNAEFSKYIVNQELVFLIAAVEGYLADCLRFICFRKPEVLKRDIKVSWNQILEIGSWDALVEHLREQFVYEAGWTINDKLLALEKHNIQLKIDGRLRQILFEAEQGRHIIIHNASKVSQEYIKKTGRTDIALGEKLEFDFDYLDQVAEISLSLVRDLTKQILNKYGGQVS